jgi:hypothetical protein
VLGHNEKENNVAQSLVAKPIEPAGPNVVVRWSKWGTGDESGYAYASIKGGDDSDNPGGALWYTTQDPRRKGGNKILPGTWDELLASIGERNWNTLELLT